MDKLEHMLTSFHEYDIRGVYPTDIDEDFFYRLGKAVAKYVGKSPVGVGHDARISSPSLTKSLIQGLVDSGIDVVFLGRVSTEIHNYASGTGKYVANVMVSASHNPKEYNGAKISLSGAIPLHGGFGLPELKALMVEELPNAAVKGEVVEEDIFESFMQNALKVVDIQSLRPMKVVVDAGNGMGGPAWQRAIELLPSHVEIVPLFLEPDGTFPNHEGDPLKDENIKDLQAKVLETGADLGIALDGDADRVFFIDENANRISGTVTIAIITDHFMRVEKRIGAYLYDVRIGRVVPEIVLKYGGTPVKTRVGHSFIKAEMRKHNGIFGGELSGHLYLQDNFNAECTLMSGLLMMQIMTESGKTASELAKEFDIYPQSGEVNFKIQDRSTMLQAIKDVYAQRADSVEEIDGVVFNYPDWWFGVRFSNTAEPLLRLNLEADNQALLDERLQEVIALIESQGAVRK
jgi:phosphomannomutase